MDFAGEFVAHDQAGLAAGVMPVVGMHVRAADTRGLDFYNDLAGFKSRFGIVPTLHFMGLRIHQGFHHLDSCCTQGKASAGFPSPG